MQRQVDLLILGGTVVTMDDEDRILDNGGLAIQDDRIVAVGTTEQVRERYVAPRTIDAWRKIIMPGLVDTYGHAGHSMIRALFHPTHGWPMMDLYWHHTTEDWWYAEALLAATERLRFGITTGASIIGAVTRADSPVFGIRNAEAYARVGIRAVLGVGPPDPIVSSLPKPWSGSHYEDGQWVTREFTYQEALTNALHVIERWHGGGQWADPDRPGSIGPVRAPGLSRSPQIRLPAFRCANNDRQSRGVTGSGGSLSRSNSHAYVRGIG